MNKRAIVTGASSGIGREIARQLAGAGWRVLAVARRIERLKELAGEFPERIVPFQADIAKADSAAAIMAEADRKLGGLDLLVNDAGASWIGRVEQMPTEAIDRILNVNVRGLILLCREAVGLLRRNGDAGGQIINISSVVSKIPMETIAVYCASKAAVSIFSATLAKELAPHRIRVNTISPCGTDSEIYQSAGGPKPDPAALVPADQMARTVLLVAELPPDLDIGDLSVHKRLAPI